MDVQRDSAADTRPQQDSARAGAAPALLMATTACPLPHGAQQWSRRPQHCSAGQPPKRQLTRVHLSLLYGLSLGLILLLILSVSQTLQQRLSSLQAQQQVQAWKDYATALKVAPQRVPEPAQTCSVNCAARAKPGVLNVESPEPHASGPRYHF